jgi:hypothetical protein
MTDYEVGHGKPPKHSRFKSGCSGNRKGRPPRQSSEMSQVLDSVLHAPMQYREGGRNRIATRQEVHLRLLVKRAVGGDVEATDLLLQAHAQALRHRETGSARLIVRDWLPDFAGQTSREKSRNVVEKNLSFGDLSDGGKRSPQSHAGKAPANPENSK